MVAWTTTTACAEEFGTLTEGYDIEGGFSASVDLRCAFTDRAALVEEIIGTLYPYGSAAMASNCAIKPVPSNYTADGQACAYEEAIVTVNYSSRIQDLISESFEPTAEFSVLDYKRFRWGAANGDLLQEGEAPGLLFKSLNLTRTMYRQPFVPTECTTMIGRVNHADYTSALLGLTFPVGTLLFQPPSTSRTLKTDGDASWTITCKFAFKPQGWNTYYRQKTQTWSDIFLHGGAQYIGYPPGNFGVLLA